MKISVFLLGLLLLPQAFANSRAPVPAQNQWYTDDGQCVRLLRHDPPVNVLKFLKQVFITEQHMKMVTQQIKNGRDDQECFDARRQALEAGAKWAAANCPQVEAIKRDKNEACPTTENDSRISNLNVHIRYAKFSFETEKGDLNILKCSPHEEQRKSVLLKVVCFNAIVKELPKNNVVRQ